MARFGDIAGPAGVATITAGPVGLAVMLVWMTIFPAPGYDSSPLHARLVAVVVSFLIMLIYAVPFGAIVGVVPSFLGTTLLASAGNRWRSMRHPFVWAATGAALGAIVARAITLNHANPQLGSAWAVATGIICMLISRSIMRWRD